MDVLNKFRIFKPIQCIILDYVSTDTDDIIRYNLSVAMSKRLFRNIATPPQMSPSQFDNLCQKGKLGTAKWIFEYIKDKMGTQKAFLMNQCFLSACIGNNVLVAKWLIENFVILTDKRTISRIVGRSSEKNAKKTIIWLISKYELTWYDLQIHMDSIIRSDSKNIFKHILITLYESPNKAPGYVVDHMFTMACTHGSEKIVKWSANEMTITNEVYKEGFRMACVCYCTNLIKWFVQEKHILDII